MAIYFVREGHELEDLLDAEDLGNHEMPERTEQEFISAARTGVEQLGTDGFIDLVYLLVEEYEDYMRANDSPAARRSLEWLEMERARRTLGFS